MAKLILAPVWSTEWKVALIVLLSLAILVCVILIAYFVIALKKTKRRAADDDFEARDDGGFNKIVRAEDYGVTMPSGYKLDSGAPVVVPPPQVKGVSLNAPPYAQGYVGQFAAPVYYDGVPPIPADISARLGYVPAPYGSTQPPQFIPPQNSGMSEYAVPQLSSQSVAPGQLPQSGQLQTVVPVAAKNAPHSVKGDTKGK